MRKISKFPICNQEKSEKFHFSAVKNFMIEATTDAMCLSSHGGLLVLRQEEHLALASQLSSCIHYSRTPYLVRHSLTEILMTRIFQICLGYEDVNDCDRMRRDPMMQLAVDTGALDKELCTTVAAYRTPMIQRLTKCIKMKKAWEFSCQPSHPLRASEKF